MDKEGISFAQLEGEGPTEIDTRGDDLEPTKRENHLVPLDDERCIDLQWAGTASSHPSIERAAFVEAVSVGSSAHLEQATSLDTLRLKQNWGIYTPGQLKKRARELGTGKQIIEGVLPEATLGILVGDSGLGKSPLLYQAAVCVAAGVPFLGCPVNQGRVLYLDFENGVGEADTLIDRLCGHLELSNPPEGQLLLWNVNDAPPKFGTLSHSALEMIREVKPSWAIIDSLGSCYPDTEEKNSNASETFQRFRTVMKECGAAITVVHHTRKPSQRRDEAPESLDGGDLRQWFRQARGAGALINGSDILTRPRF